MSGHHPVHVGLQKHSVSDDYPLHAVGIGNGDRVHWVVSNLCTGKDLHLVHNGLTRCTFLNARDAFEVIEWAKAHNFLNGVSEFGMFQWGDEIAPGSWNAEERQVLKLAADYKPFHGGYPGEWPIT